MVMETLSSLLHQCSKTKALRCGLSLHSAAIKTGVLCDVIVSNHVLNMYAKCGNSKSAHQVFNEMPNKNLVSWSAMISGYDQSGQHLMAIKLFSQMHHLEPNEYILASSLSSCANLSALKAGQQIHCKSIKLGYSSVSFVSNSLMSMYMKCSRCDDAFSIFASASAPSVVSFNAIITGMVENNDKQRAFEMFRLMCQQGLVPDRFTFVGLFGTCSAEDWAMGMSLHGQTIKLNLDSSAFIGNVIMTMYSRLNLIGEAEKAFRMMGETDTISWNTLMAACSSCDDHQKALDVFRDMVNRFVTGVDDFSYASALSASAGMASVRLGGEIHARLVRTRANMEIAVSNALVNMYAKCGCMQHAHAAFNLMHTHNLVSWNTLIAGFANHGHGRKAIQLYEEMQRLGFAPDSVTFLGLLTACNHAGLVDEGHSFFVSMQEAHGIAPTIEHFSCLLDLLGRAGRLKTAEEYMQILEGFPFGDDSVALGCLLSACRLHGDVAAGERVAERLMAKEPPATTSPYVLLSHLYASDGMWSGVAGARRLLKGSGLKKEAGHSLVEVKGFLEKFTIGDFSHPRIPEILQVLKSLSWVPPDEEDQ